MNSRFESIESVHNYHKLISHSYPPVIPPSSHPLLSPLFCLRTGVSGQFSRIRQELKERDDRTKEKQDDVHKELSHISGDRLLSSIPHPSPSRSADQISQLDKRLSDQEEKISRLYNLHGKMLERMDRIDTTQSKHADELAGAVSLPPLNFLTPLPVLHGVVERVDSMATRHETNVCRPPPHLSISTPLFTPHSSLREQGVWMTQWFISTARSRPTKSLRNKSL
jgi:hypothetical protein